jgi:hypothetical protein
MAITMLDRGRFYGLVATLKEWSAVGVAIDSGAGGRKSRPGRDEESKMMIVHMKL